jgi:two-component system chemotaxis response regulator CheY
MKALVVDDDIVSRIALADLLSGYGIFDLVEAEDGGAAWQLLEAGLRPVICFCDVRMPRMSGIDLLQRMKADPELAEVPFVLVSSASDRDTVLAAVKLGAIGYILKPLHAADARAHLERIFKVTLDKLAEHPFATMKRLNIGAERVAAYLHAFGQQLASAQRELADAGASEGAGPGLRLRIDAAHTGCITLGLWHAASLLERARSGVLDSARASAALAEVAEAVARQSLRARTGADTMGALA